MGSEYKIIEELFDPRYAEVNGFRFVQDNLNPHPAESFYQAFEPEEARQLKQNIEYHYTPKFADSGIFRQYEHQEYSVISAHSLEVINFVIDKTGNKTGDLDKWNALVKKYVQEKFSIVTGKSQRILRRGSFASVEGKSLSTQRGREPDVKAGLLSSKKIGCHCEALRSNLAGFRGLLRRGLLAMTSFVRGPADVKGGERWVVFFDVRQPRPFHAGYAGR